MHNYGVSSLDFPNLQKIFTLPELQVFLEISVDGKFLVSQKGNCWYCKWIKQALISGFFAEKSIVLMFQVVLHRQVDKKRRDR